MPLLVSAGAKNRGRQDFKKNMKYHSSLKQWLPTRGGVYLISGTSYGDGIQEIDVYSHPIKGPSCFSEDFGSEGTGVNEATDCHVSVQCTGLDFIMWLGNSRGSI
jgi:hypothetical protein